tara:strand:- start:4826 stop:5866 length:1041 start_codon:yes stop_codon:yes gene_type:complete
MQIQRVKNALLAPFIFSDKVGESQDTLNVFTLKIKELVDELVGFFIIEDEMGNKLTQHGKDIKTFVVDAIGIAVDMIKELKKVFLESETGLDTFTSLLHMAVVPMKVMLQVLDFLGPNLIKWIVWFKVINSLLPINTVLMGINSLMKYKLLVATQTLAAGENIEATAVWGSTLAWTAHHTAMTMGLGAVILGVLSIKTLSTPLIVLTGILWAAALAWTAFHGAWSLGVNVALITGALAVGYAVYRKMQQSADATAALNANWGHAGGMTAPATIGSVNTTSIGGMTGVGAIAPAGMTAGGGRTSTTHIEIHGDVYDKEGFRTVLNETFQDMDDNGELSIWDKPLGIT